MKLKRFFALAALAAAIFASAAAEAAHHRDKRDRRPPEGMRPQISAETRKLAAACRRDPSEENRAALRKQIGVEYDRFLDEQRARIKGGKHDRKAQEARHRLDILDRDREKNIDRIMQRLLNPQDRPNDRPGKGPKPSKKRN